MSNRFGSVAVGLFGKYRGQGDFVRLSGSGTAFPELEAWIHASAERLPSDRRGLPEAPVGFVLVARQQMFVGGLVASEDRVGRRFPLAIFAAVESSEHASDYPILPVGFAEFLAHAYALLDGRRSLDEVGLRSLFELLSAPNDEALRRASKTLISSLSSITARALLTQMFATDDSQAHVHGLAMFVGACRRARGEASARAPITLDCPAPGDVERGFWLAAARGLLNGGPPAPTFLWSSTERRLVLSLGPPSPHLLRLWNDPMPPDSSWWSVHPREGTPSSDIGQRELSPDLLQWLVTAPGTAHDLLGQIIAT